MHRLHIEITKSDSSLVYLQLKKRPFWLATDISALQQQHQQLQQETPKLGSKPQLQTTQTVTNKFNTPSSATTAAVASTPNVLQKTNNLQQQQQQQQHQLHQQSSLGHSDVVQTVKVANTTTLSRSFGSLLSNLNKSVNTAFNSIISFQQPDLAPGFRSPQQQQQLQQQPQQQQQHQQAPSPAVARSSVGYPPAGQRFSPAFARSPVESRSPSPGHGIGFSAAVSNICDQAHSIAERDRHTNTMARIGELTSLYNSLMRDSSSERSVRTCF